MPGAPAYVCSPTHHEHVTATGLTHESDRRQSCAYPAVGAPPGARGVMTGRRGQGALPSCLSAPSSSLAPTRRHWTRVPSPS